MPYQPKSASPNVVLAKPKAPSTLSKKAGRNVIRIPFTKPPQAAPQRPPVALPKTPAVPPVKKCGTMPGRISVSTQALPNPQAISRRLISPPRTLVRKPISTALGAEGKETGQDSGGGAPG